MMSGSLASAFSAILLGAALGFVLQRGRFCLNTAFRDIIFLKDVTMFRAYILAIVVAIVGTNLMDDMGLLITVNQETGDILKTTLLRQRFVPLANILGGFVFGLGIVLAGGCASGIVYRLGEGQIGAMVGILGFFLGVAMTADGILSPVSQFLKGFSVDISGSSGPALWDVFGGGMLAKWATIAALAVALMVFVMRGKPSLGSASKGYSWALTGVLIGVLTISAWWISSYFGGVPRGLAITTPIREFFNTMLYKSSNSPFPEFSFFGIFKGTWGVFFIFALPLGAFASAVGLKEFKWKTPPAKEILTVFAGSVIMGVGAVVAGGCNLGHGVTGVSTMSVASLVAIASIILGNWTMVYFKFIKPMQE